VGTAVHGALIGSSVAVFDPEVVDATAVAGRVAVVRVAETDVLAIRTGPFTLSLVELATGEPVGQPIRFGVDVTAVATWSGPGHPLVVAGTRSGAVRFTDPTDANAAHPTVRPHGIDTDGICAIPRTNAAPLLAVESDGFTRCYDVATTSAERRHGDGTALIQI
jgi:hypothetical protein